MTTLRRQAIAPAGHRPRRLALALVVLAMALPATARAAADDEETRPDPDAPGEASPAVPRESGQPLADDPGIDVAIRDVLAEARLGKPVVVVPGPHGAHLRLFWQGFQFHCAAGPCWYNGAGLVVYPSAWIDFKGGWRALRFGLGLGGAGEGSQERQTWWQHDFLLEALLVVGLQYPWKLTPYVEFVVGLGAMHRNLYNQDDVFFAYSFGLQAGLEWFVYKAFNLGATVGWRRSLMDIGPQTIYADSVYVAVGIGF